MERSERLPLGLRSSANMSNNITLISRQYSEFSPSMLPALFYQQRLYDVYIKSILKPQEIWSNLYLIVKLEVDKTVNISLQNIWIWLKQPLRKFFSFNFCFHIHLELIIIFIINTSLSYCFAILEWTKQAEMLFFCM